MDKEWGTYKKKIFLVKYFSYNSVLEMRMKPTGNKRKKKLKTHFNIFERYYKSCKHPKNLVGVKAKGTPKYVFFVLFSFNYIKIGISRTK